MREHQYERTSKDHLITMITFLLRLIDVRMRNQQQALTTENHEGKESEGVIILTHAKVDSILFPIVTLHHSVEAANEFRENKLDDDDPVYTWNVSTTSVPVSLPPLPTSCSLLVKASDTQCDVIRTAHTEIV